MEGIKKNIFLQERNIVIYVTITGLWVIIMNIDNGYKGKKIRNLGAE